MKTRTVTLTQANDEGFDPEKFNFDIKNMSNVQVFCVLRVVELVKEGNLHYVKLEFNEGEVADPKSDPMIVGTISRFIPQESNDDVSLDTQWRVMWDNKLWRPLDDDAATLLECFRGIDKNDIKAFADKLSSDQFRQNLQTKLLSEAAKGSGWENLNQ
ncbi:MAG: hypothetical protein ACR2PH_16455 [Desulfobulbia bacterium]